MSECIVVQGEVREKVRLWPDEYFNCVMTSPPYWGLRDYGIEAQIWDGEEDCEHEWGDELQERKRGSIGDKSTFEGGKTTQEHQGTTVYQGQFCLHCNAWKGSLGLEPTPELYIQHIVQVFREVKRVLRKDGSVWLNLGDCYAGSGAGGGGNYKGNEHGQHANMVGKRPVVPSNLKPKDLCGIPWRVALALQADGWWLRSDIIWHKPNPMPESVKDRPTRSHEYIFLLTKASKYYYDSDAVKEKASTPLNSTAAQSFGSDKKLDDGVKAHTNVHGKKYRDERSAFRNRRTVWTLPTQPYKGAHFAVFPEKLVEPCVLAGCPPDGIVLDPMAGSGTVGVVAKKLGRRSVLIELNPEYIKLIEKRLREGGK